MGIIHITIKKKLQGTSYETYQLNQEKKKVLTNCNKIQQQFRPNLKQALTF
jgi:hypothetical protein